MPSLREVPDTEEAEEDGTGAGAADATGITGLMMGLLSYREDIETEDITGDLRWLGLMQSWRARVDPTLCVHSSMVPVDIRRRLGLMLPSLGDMDRTGSVASPNGEAAKERRRHPSSRSEAASLDSSAPD